VAVSMAIARASATLHQNDFTIADPMATNGANPCWLWRVWSDPANVDFLNDVFAVTMSSRLVLNAVPTKLGTGCVMKVARQLASDEIEDCAISERMGSSNYMLDGICKAICSPGEYQLDAVWASWVLVVYLCCHPEGRVLLRKTPLTDLDYQTATAFEAYGRAEITRRARLETQQQQAQLRKKQKSDDRPPSSMPRNEGVKQETPTPETTPIDSSENVIDELAAEENKVLATKRKRGAKGCASASTSDSSGMLQWWFGALRCDNNSVLMSLIAHSKQAAKNAACQTLEKQADGAAGVASNVVIRGISEQNAVTSAQALVPFVGRRPVEIPGLMAWTWKGKEYRGISRIQNEARTTTLHTCCYAPTLLQPTTSTKLVVTWSMNSIQYAPRSDECMTLPGILERLENTVHMRDQGKRGEVVASRMGAMVLGEAEPPRSTAVSGNTRSTLSMEIMMGVTTDQLRVGVDLGEKLKFLPKAASYDVNRTVPELSSQSQCPEDRLEPLCNPGTRLALGIAMNEEVRTWMMGKTRKNDPCKVILSVSSAQERARDAPAIINAEPPPLLAITDFKLDMTREALRHLDRPLYMHDPPNPMPDVPFGLALHVCGDGATRVPEMLVALHPYHSSSNSLYQFVAQARATVWAAMSQASYISNVAPTISAGYANSAISSSKKISVADTHRLPLLSAFDVYAAGIMNVEASHVSTPYAGTYGCCFDHGVSPPGTF